VSDRYDYHAPGFVPDKFNSLMLKETNGTSGASELKTTADSLMAEFLKNPVVRPVLGDDTAVVIYDGDIYIVGDYIRHLMEDEHADYVEQLVDQDIDDELEEEAS